MQPDETEKPRQHTFLVLHNDVRAFKERMRLTERPDKEGKRRGVQNIRGSTNLCLGYSRCKKDMRRTIIVFEASQYTTALSRSHQVPQTDFSNILFIIKLHANTLVITGLTINSWIFEVSEERSRLLLSLAASLPFSPWTMVSVRIVPWCSLLED